MQTFEFRFDGMWRGPVKLVTGATPANSHVTLGDGRLVIDFGRFGIDTPIDNVKDVQVTRDYAWYKAIGLRGSMVDKGATYGSSTVGGVCICFHEPVAAGLPVRSPGLTVTVADIDGLAAAVRDAAGLDASPES